MGPRRIHRCKVCGRKFTPKNQKPEEESIVTESLPQQQPAFAQEMIELMSVTNLGVCPSNGPNKKLER
jgi:hypothetical protein